MDVNIMKPTDRVIAAGVNAAGVASENSGAAPAIAAQSAEASNEIKKAESSKEASKEPTKEDFSPITKQLNEFMTYLNADIQFELHERTHRLMVRVVDTKENRVLREFPPKELLDTIANIREYVGVLLDKKA